MKRKQKDRIPFSVNQEASQLERDGGMEGRKERRDGGEEGEERGGGMEGRKERREGGMEGRKGNGEREGEEDKKNKKTKRGMGIEDRWIVKVLYLPPKGHLKNNENGERETEREY